MKNENKTQTTPDVKNIFSQIESTLELYFGQKAPAMPVNIKEALVKYSPYITLIVMILALPVILAIFGLGAMMSPFAYLGSYRAGINFSLTSIFALAVIIMQGLALPALFKRQISGWKFMYYAALIQVVENLINFDLGSLIISGAISFYILFQIKSYYK